MKNLFNPKLLCLFLLTFSGGILLYGNYFEREQLFNRPADPQPATGVDILRKEYPYIVIRDINNSTNGTQVNRRKYVTIPAISGSNLYAMLGDYLYDVQKKKWNINQVSNYIIEYNFNNGTVPKAFVHHRFADSLNNHTYKTLFSFNTDNLPDTQKYYLISHEDTVYYACIVFDYDKQKRLTHLRYSQTNGYSDETFFTFENGNLITALKLIFISQFSVPDSMLYSYQYDSMGRITQYKEEEKPGNGNPGSWLLRNMKSYTYDVNGQLSGDRLYEPDSGGNAELKEINLYTYTGPGKMETWINIINPNGSSPLRNKLMLTYQGNKAVYAYRYPWLDIDYSHTPSSYYLFSDEDITGVKTPISSNKSIALYPNPAGNYIRLHHAEAGSALEIRDVNGKIALVIENYQGEDIDVSEFAPGLYLIIADKQKPIKFIKS